MSDGTPAADTRPGWPKRGKSKPRASEQAAGTARTPSAAAARRSRGRIERPLFLRIRVLPDHPLRDVSRLEHRATAATDLGASSHTLPESVVEYQLRRRPASGSSLTKRDTFRMFPSQLPSFRVIFYFLLAILFSLRLWECVPAST